MQVKWDENKCCHAGVCVSTLPAVFKIENGQFVIDTNAAPEAAITDVVNQCPSGALQIVHENT